jgi:MFS family permease
MAGYCHRRGSDVTRHSHRGLIALGLAVCLSLFGDLTLYAVLVTQLETTGLALGAVGIMLGINRLIRIPGNLLGGLLLDRYGRRRLFILGMGLGVVSTAGYGLLRGFWPFLVARLAWGMAWVLINVGGMTMALDMATSVDRGRLMGIYNAWMLAGLALGPMVGGFLVDTLGFQMAMLACASITAVGTAVAVATLPETAPAKQFHPEALHARWHLSPRSAHEWNGSWPDMRLLSVFGIHLLIQFAGEGITLSTVTLLLQQRFGHSVILLGLTLGVASAGGLLLGVRSLLAGAVGPLIGHVSDVAAKRWPLIVAGLGLAVLGFGLLAWAISLWQIVLGIVLGAAGAGTILALLSALIGDLVPPERHGLVMGGYATAGDIGSTAGPFLAFALLSLVELRWVYLLCAMLLLLGLGLAWRAQEA